ncbi:MAG: guanylate kinase [Rhodospirillales bacterium]|nr:guanylate kinase [Rhodospirillales bacterium]
MQHGINRRGLMLVLSSPSGAGKTTISRELLRRESGLVMSTSATTRPARPGEVDGRDYFFKSVAEFETMAEKGEFLEHARVFDNFYGTPRAPVEAALKSGHDVLFDVDWQGTQKLKESARADLASVFILPPSLAELEQRLRTRAQDPPEVVRSRMARAAAEMSHWAEYDYIVVNVDVESSIARVRAILAAERLRRDRQSGLAEFVAKMCEEK